MPPGSLGLRFASDEALTSSKAMSKGLNDAAPSGTDSNLTLAYLVLACT